MVISGEFFVLFALLGALPFVLISVTSFVKLAVVFSLVRNALGVQQVPPNVVLYGLALTVSAYIMAPVGAEILAIVQEASLNGLAPQEYWIDAAEPLRQFLVRHADAKHINFFRDNIDRIWGGRLETSDEVKELFSILPSFTTSELEDAFKIGFLIYLPFIAIDLIVSNILLALGMMMVSPVTIALPFKLFLFVALEGWTRLIRGLVLSYA